MITKESTNEDIIEFVKKYIKEEEIKNFKNENIKGNELLFFLDEENNETLKKLVKIPNRLKNQLKQIKNNNKDILSFDIILNELSKENEIKLLLKSEMKIEDKTIIDNFENIDGKIFITLTEDNLKNYNLKLGEIKKLTYYLKLIRTITTEEICKFLQNEFHIS